MDLIKKNRSSYLQKSFDLSKSKLSKSSEKISKKISTDSHERKKSSDSEPDIKEIKSDYLND